MSKMIRIVAIECSTNTASVALLQGDVVIQETYAADGRQSDRILQGVDSLLTRGQTDISQIDAIAVAVGPGAFTGVRLAIAAAQGLALAWNIPVIPVSTLAALALAVTLPAGRSATVLAVLDARMGEVYAGWFEVNASGVAALTGESVLAPDQLTRPGEDAAAYTVIGQGFAAYAEQIVDALGVPEITQGDAVPTAADVARHAVGLWPDGACPPDDVEAAYLRNKVALTSIERDAATKL